MTKLKHIRVCADRFWHKPRMHAERLKRIQQNLNGLTIEQLSDVLVCRTLHLLDLLGKKSVDGIEYRDTKLEVECIQEAIRKNRCDK